MSRSRSWNGPTSWPSSPAAGRWTTRRRSAASVADRADRNATVRVEIAVRDAGLAGVRHACALRRRHPAGAALTDQPQPAARDDGALRARLADVRRRRAGAEGVHCYQSLARPLRRAEGRRLGVPGRRGDGVAEERRIRVAGPAVTDHGQAPDRGQPARIRRAVTVDAVRPADRPGAGAVARARAGRERVRQLRQQRRAARSAVRGAAIGPRIAARARRTAEGLVAGRNRLPGAEVVASLCGEHLQTDRHLRRVVSDLARADGCDQRRAWRRVGGRRRETDGSIVVSRTLGPGPRLALSEGVDALIHDVGREGEAPAVIRASRDRVGTNQLIDRDAAVDADSRRHLGLAGVGGWRTVARPDRTVALAAVGPPVVVAAARHDRPAQHHYQAQTYTRSNCRRAAHLGRTLEPDGR